MATCCHSSKESLPVQYELHKSSNWTKKTVTYCTYYCKYNYHPNCSAGGSRSFSHAVERCVTCHCGQECCVRQPILLHISSDDVKISQCWSSSGPHTFYLHVRHCSGHTPIVSTSDMSIIGELLSAELLLLR